MMNANQFDTIVRDVTVTSSRRRALSGILGGAAAALTGPGLPGLVAAKKGGNGKGKGRGKAKGKGRGKGRGNGKGKVLFCHLNGNGSYTFISVSRSARDTHLRHGDVECAANPCEGQPQPCDVTCTATGECIVA